MVSERTEPDLSRWKQEQDRRRRTSRNRAIVAVALLALIAGVVAVAATRGGGGESVAPPPPSHTGTTAPVRPRALGPAIVGLDGTVRRALGLPTDAWMADLSSDGSRVAFLTMSPTVGFCGGCTPHTDRLAVVRVGRASGAFIYLDHGDSVRRVEEPVWSPDGGRIAFVGLRRDGNRDIYVVDLRPSQRTGNPPTPIITGAVRRLTDDAAVDEFPAWSPDGSAIYYDSAGRVPLDDAGFSNTQEIWRVALDGGAPQRLTHNRIPDAQADVAADGTVAFWHGGDIWTMDPTGGNQRRLRAVPSDTGFNPRWSPDGTKIALLRYAGDHASFAPRQGVVDDLPLLNVVVVDLATGKVTRVGARVASDVNPVSWMPGGFALLIDRFDDGG